MLLIGVLCFLAMMTEGAIGDWSGIYLRQDLGVERPRRPPPAYTGFSLGMAIARLGGDCDQRAPSAPARLLRGGMALVAHRARRRAA